MSGNWEAVAPGTSRLHVPGGWLYVVKFEYGTNPTSCFVPDKDAWRNSWHYASIDELTLSVRTRRTLTSEGIETLGQLVSRTDQELLCIPDFGRKCLEDVREALERFWQRENVKEPDVTENIG